MKNIEKQCVQNGVPHLWHTKNLVIPSCTPKIIQQTCWQVTRSSAAVVNQGLNIKAWSLSDMASALAKA
jgi:hypothetical protein